jgi:hypothetical protein
LIESVEGRLHRPELLKRFVEIKRRRFASVPEWMDKAITGLRALAEAQGIGFGKVQPGPDGENKR